MDTTETLRPLSATDDYKDHHRLLGIQRMLNNLKPIASRSTWSTSQQRRPNAPESSAPAEPPPMGGGC